MLTISQTPLFSYEALQKSSLIVNDYVYDLYFPIHGLSSRDIFTYCPTLLAIESMVYQVDLVAENAKNVNVVQAKNEDFKTLTMQKYSFMKLLKKIGFDDLLIKKELANGEEYVKLENKVTSGGVIQHSEVMRIAELRPSDVRLLHCILFHLLKKPYDENLLSLLWPVEVIADIENDFKHYPDDVAKERYNTYHSFVKLYKEKAPNYIKAELEHYENLFKEKLATFPTNMQQNLMALYSQFRQKNSFSIPKPILDNFALI